MEPAAMGEENTPAIELHIQELALHGFPEADRHSIGETVERELARLLGERDDRSGLVDREIARLDGGTFAVAPNATSEMIGIQIAQAIYSGLIR
jgi:hypothetical protein